MRSLLRIVVFTVLATATPRAFSYEAIDLPIVHYPRAAYWETSPVPAPLGPLDISLDDAAVIQDCSPTTIRCVGGAAPDYATIQLAVTAAQAGDTVLVFDKASSAVYNEAVTSNNAGTAGNPITIKAEFDCASDDGATVEAACVSVRGFATSDAYIVVQGFEITHQGMTGDGNRLVSFGAGSDNAQLLNNYIHHSTSANECVIIATLDNVVMRGNRIETCRPRSTIFATTLGPFNIQAGVNDKISVSVQGGAPQTFTLTPGAARTTAQIGADVDATIKGAIACNGLCEQIFTINSTTDGLTSSIELLGVANDAYTTLGMTVGLGELYSYGPAINTNGAPTDWLVENNYIVHVSDCFYPNSAVRVVFRDNTCGVNDEYTPVHVDVWQGGTGSQSLMENVRVIDGNNVQHHIVHNEGTATHMIIRRMSTCRHRGSVATHTGTNDLYLYNSTFYDNFAVFQGVNGGQMYVRGASNTRNFARNNIWWNSSESVAVYLWDTGAAAIDVDYDLWGGGTTSTNLSTQAHDVNADPLVTNAANCDFTLTAPSPAIDAGGPLTTVHANDSGAGTTLVLTNARMFQDGWAGVIPDKIAVGSVTNVAQIVSINYTTGEVVIDTDIPREDDDEVWWYADSRGNIVLKGSAPDIGALEFEPTAGSGPARRRLTRRP